MKLIVGLGNPGRTYVNSRHNIGFQCLNLFARKHGIDFNKQQAKARVGFGEVAGEKLILAKPRTFMNLSGESVAPMARYYKIDLSDILVIYDDLSFSLGKIRIREKGGSGGHNGLKSIIYHLGSEEFPRIRVGIAPQPTEELPDHIQKTRTPEYVLGHFTAEEKVIVPKVCATVTKAIYCILEEGIATAMNNYNSPVIS